MAVMVDNIMMYNLRFSTPVIKRAPKAIKNKNDKANDNNRTGKTQGGLLVP
jgi:hypothetical protein